MKNYPIKKPSEYYKPDHFSKDEYSYEKYSDDDKELDKTYIIPEKERFSFTEISNKIYKKSKNVAKD